MQRQQTITFKLDAESAALLLAITAAAGSGSIHTTARLLLLSALHQKERQRQDSEQQEELVLLLTHLTETVSRQSVFIAMLSELLLINSGTDPAATSETIQNLYAAVFPSDK